MKREKKPPLEVYAPLALRKGTPGPEPADTKMRRRKGYGDERCICINSDCRLRAAGCRGFMGCPGFKGI
jgi:hypothetical protein